MESEIERNREVFETVLTASGGRSQDPEPISQPRHQSVG